MNFHRNIVTIRPAGLYNKAQSPETKSRPDGTRSEEGAGEEWMCMWFVAFEFPIGCIDI